MTEQVSLHRAGVAYEGHPVLHDIDLALGEHERVALIGANGCGKSSLLRLIHGLLPLCSGQRLQDPNTRLGMMFQRPHMLNTTTQRHVAIGPWLAGRAWRTSMDLAMEALSRVGLEHVAAQSARTLSGGQQQRVALARALMEDTELVLLDEPFSALDAQTKMVLQQDLAQTLAEEKKTTLFITHDLVEAIALSDRVLVMSKRPGTIIEEIVVDIPGRDNPMGRRSNARVGEYVARLMELLHIGELVTSEAI